MLRIIWEQSLDFSHCYNSNGFSSQKFGTFCSYTDLKLVSMCSAALVLYIEDVKTAWHVHPCRLRWKSLKEIFKAINDSEWIVWLNLLFVTSNSSSLFRNVYGTARKFRLYSLNFEIILRKISGWPNYFPADNIAPLLLSNFHALNVFIQIKHLYSFTFWYKTRKIVARYKQYLVCHKRLWAAEGENGQLLEPSEIINTYMGKDIVNPMDDLSGGIFILWEPYKEHLII